MKEERKTSKQSIIILLLLCAAVICCTLVYVGNSLGWLGKSNVAYAKNPQMQIDYNNDVQVNRMVVYKYKIEENRATAQLDIPGKPQYMKLNQYDTIFTERNVYTPMIIMIPLESIPEGLFEVQLSCTGDLLATDSDAMAKNISNVISIRCGYSSNLDSAVVNDETDDTAQDFYRHAIAFFSDRDTDTKAYLHQSNTGYATDNTWVEETFVNLGDMTQKNKEMVFTVDTRQAKQASPSGLQEGNLKLYLMVDYQYNLVQKYLTDHLIKASVTFLEADELVHTMTPDLTKIEFEITEVD